MISGPIEDDTQSTAPFFYVYILECADGSYYTGHCRELEARVNQHNSGAGAKHTRENRPVTLVYFERFPTEAEAVRRELQLKRWTRAKKKALITQDTAGLRRLSRRRK